MLVLLLFSLTNTVSTMNHKTATIIGIHATDNTRYAQATQVSWSQITFIDNTEFVIETNPRRNYESNHELCFVHRAISSEQKGLNGIHHGDLIGAKYYKDVLCRVMSSVNDDYIICYDAKLTKRLLVNAGVPVDAFNFICLSSVIKKLYPNQSSYTIATLIYEFCENTAISYMPHNWHGRYDTTFMRHIFKQVSILKGLSTMQDWYELSNTEEKL